MSTTAGKAPWWHRISEILRRELTELTIVSAYLYVCFGAMVLFKTAVLREHGIDFAAYGTAAVKALVLGKFILVGNDLHIGERFNDKPLIYPLVHKVLVFSVLLVFLSIIEEVALAALHGRPLTADLFSFTRRTWLEITASSLLLILILTPYVGFTLIGDALGAGVLSRLFLGDPTTGVGSNRIRTDVRADRSAAGPWHRSQGR
jgi:hypothetical protein